jgi:hypothetical protein
VSDEPGQEPGQPPAGLSWGELVEALVETHGTLTAVAWKLIEKGDDVASIERALRRLRGRGQLDGGVWGQRLLRVFGVPKSVEARLRWMGLYQSPFNDLPLALCLDQLRMWDRPPISESRARVWLHLGHASCALRQQQFDTAETQLAAARAALAGLDATYDSARIELSLASAYLATRTGGDVDVLLEAIVLPPSLTADERACFEARLVDQRAYQLNKRHDDPAGALAMYEALPDADVHPFASYRRDAGRAWGNHRAGNTARALELAHRACEHAGDGGYTRLRAMGLILITKIGGGAAYLARARAIATRLDDRELLVRCERAASPDRLRRDEA